VSSKAEMVDVHELFDWSVYGQVATYHCSKHFKIPWLRKTIPRFEVRKDFSGLFSKTLKNWPQQILVGGLNPSLVSWEDYSQYMEK
jgi:hypothetical protein